MTKGHLSEGFKAIVICKTFDEVRRLKLRFPSDWYIIVEGGALVSFRAQGIFVTQGVDTNSRWFRECAMLRLVPTNGPVLRIEMTDVTT